MDLVWPWFLVLLALIPVLIGVYILILSRRRRYAVRFSSLALVREALPRTSSLRRHLPFVIFLLALTSLIVALVRPVSIISVPTNQTTIILAIDVSLSMRSRDIQPTRLEAAQAAALNFIQRQKSGTQIGIVAFSGFAELVQPPTTDQEALTAAVESLTLARRTAIGSGILKSLDAISQIDPNVAPSVSDPTSTNQPAPVLKGAYAPDIIVLLTDGVSNTGPLPLDAAQQAVDRGVRIYPIGFGTANGYIPFGGGGPFGSDNPFGNGGGQQFSGGGGFPTGIDDTTMKEIAAMTGGQYYTATTADELQKVFQGLPTYLITRHETIEISVIFTAIGALLAALAILLSMLWRPLP
ncbi:MAG TPA: VWA domain-containing protein [Anaerolineaceae bacterium]